MKLDSAFNRSLLQRVMGWAMHYAIRLKRPLNDDERKSLAECGVALCVVTRGTAYLDAWAHAIPAEELERLRKIAEQSQQSEMRDYPDDREGDYRGFVQLRTQAQFMKALRQFQQLEELLPWSEFTISDDYNILEPTRPSQWGKPPTRLH